MNDNLMKCDRKRKAVLIVGADSMIGKALESFLGKGSNFVFGTTRRSDRIAKNRIYLDLSDDLAEWIPPRPVGVAYICAGETRLDACRLNPVGSARVNLTGIAALTESLVKTEAFVVFLSTNQVFDGSRPLVEPDQPFCPVTEYGRQKAGAEKVLGQWVNSTAIVRLTKVLGPNTLFSEWSKSLRAGESIRPLRDMYLAPIPLITVLSALQLIGELRSAGIWQISGERDVSYAEAAVRGCKKMRINPGLVQPLTVPESGLKLEANPKHTTLNTDRLKLELGFAAPPVQWTIDQAFEEAKGTRSG